MKPKQIILPIQCPAFHTTRLSLPGCGILMSLVLCWPSCTVLAQEEAGIKEITSTIAETFTEEEDLSELTERLSAYIKHPLDLNHTNPDQLKELFFLSPLQISNFFTHIQTNGKLKEIPELQSIDGFDVQTITRLLPFVTVRQENEYHHLNLSKVRMGDNEIILRYGQLLEKQKGFKTTKDSRYLGSPSKILFKYKYNLSDLVTLSLVAEKDAGEAFFSGSAKSGFDFISGSLALYKTGRLKKLIIGDYSLQFGQGLTLWSGSSFGKGDDVSGIAKKDTGLKPYTSANEHSFFRGIGVTYNILKNTDLTSFISLKSLDASLTKNAEGTYNLSAISTSGLHRTAAEIQHKGTLGLLLYGMAVTYNRNNLDIGITAYHSSYQHEFITGNQRYKKYGFRGKELTNLGLHYNYTFKNIYFFGEATRSIPGGIALLNGAMASLSPSVSMVLLYRDYAKEHISFYNKGMGEGTTTANEKGIYSGIHFSPSRKWTVSANGDIFSFPWARYRVDHASSGYTLMGSLKFNPHKTFSTLLSWKTRHNAQNEETKLPVNPIVNVSKDNYRLEVHWKPNQKTDLQSRLELTQYQKGKSAIEYGFMICQDVDYHPLSSRFSANIRLAFFHTASYNSRIYAYEDDVLHGAGSGVYSGQGIRAFLNVGYRLSKHLRVWSRYAIYHYPGMTGIGSGLDEITGNSKSDIRIQLRYQF